jgi:hypothetical protein
MQKRNIWAGMLTVTVLSLLISSCTTVKEYQKNKINDAEMELSARKVEKGENSFQTYSEGASGANGGKVGGGCGCN